LNGGSGAKKDSTPSAPIGGVNLLDLLI